MNGFLALIVLALVHLYANQSRVLGWVWHGRFLSFAAGISFAYVFVDLLPALEQNQPILKDTFNFIPYFDKHAYLIAFFGVLFFYGIHTKTMAGTPQSYWISLGGYLFFNLLVGASLSDSRDPDIQPIILFVIAMGMHYFVRDHTANIDNTKLYEHQARWFLVAALFIGYAIGYLTHIPDALVAIAVSFLAGGVFLNALHYELPKREQIGYLFFVAGSLLYTALLLSLGEP